MRPRSDPSLANLPEIIRHQPWLRRSQSARGTPLSLSLTAETDVYTAVSKGTPPWPDWEATGETVDLVGASIESLALFRRHHLAGDRVEIPNAALVVFVPTRPLAPPQAIRDLQVEESSSAPATWLAAGSLQRGDRPYGPSGPAFTQLPSDLVDSDWLRTPPLDSNPRLRVHFTAADHLEITIGLDAGIITPPAWLHDWQSIDQKATLGGRRLSLYRRRFELGAAITLGENGTLANAQPAPMYVVFARSVRPSVTYAAPLTRLTAASPVVTWTIEVGVGDRYGFVIPYRKPDAGTGRVRYELIEQSGTVLCTDSLNWTAAESIASLRTCTSINAGTYHVRLTLLEGPSVALTTLTVE